MSRKCWKNIGLITIFICCFLFAAGLLHPEKIKIKTEKGVTVVYNPKKPAPPPGEPSQLILKEDLTIGLKEGQEDYILLQPVDLDVDAQGNIYVLDRKASHIKVYDKNGKFLRTISKKGQGPGEVQGPRDIHITPEGEILVNDTLTRRLLFFSLDGKFIREVSAGKMWMLLNPKVDTSGNIIAAFTLMGEEFKEELKKFDSQLKPILTIASIPVGKPPVFNPYFPRVYWCVDKEDNIIWGITTKYEFNIINHQGKLIKKIVKDYNPEKITKKDKAKMIKDMYGDNPVPSDVKLEFPKNFPAFWEFTCDKQGRIFVRTHEKEKEEKGSYYDVFDPEGRYIAKVFLKVRPRLWKQNKMYTIYEDEEGYRYIKRFSVAWK